jgi:hypothetical protein
LVRWRTDGTRRLGARSTTPLRPAGGNGDGVRVRQFLGGDYMNSEYVTNTRHFLTRNDVTWRASMEGTSFVLGTTLLLSTVAAVIWLRRKGR